MSNHNIRLLRDANLPAELAYQLTRIISSYRTHDEPPSKDLLGERIQKEESTMDELVRLQSYQTYHRQQYIQRQNQLAYQTLSQEYYEQGK